MNKQNLIRQLAKILPGDQLLHSLEDLKPYECDALSAYQIVPLAVTIPESIEQIKEILSVCYLNDIPVVARGAGTGLSGGALPHEEGILLSLAKFNQIISIDSDNHTAVVQPGVRNLAIPHCSGSARRKKPGDFRGCKRIWPLLRPRSIITDSLLDRWQCCRECRRRTLP